MSTIEPPLPSAILRAPPFPDLAELSAHSLPAKQMHPPNAAAREALFEAVRAARVGGTFWGDAPAQQRPLRTVLRPRFHTEASALREEFAGQDSFWTARDAALATSHKAGFDCGPDADPWAILPGAERLVAHGDDEWVALARIAGLPVYILSPGPFGTPEESDSALDERAAQALCQPMRDPFGNGWLGPQEAVRLLADWRRLIDGNRGAPGETIVAACGMSWWKRAEIRRFLWVPGSRLYISSSPSRALSNARKRGGALAVWPSRISPSLVSKAAAQGVALVQVEDGFVRSAGLGSSLVPPSSVVVDRQGIHFDPTGPSDLETVLATTQFSPALLQRARTLRESIVAAGISKYAGGGARKTERHRQSPARRVVLVPGQVEDDMSVLAGGGGMTSNLELLRRARALEPEAEIWWRPHPDVDAGHRVGAVTDESALEYADSIVREGSMADLLDQVDALHVLTSLSGFEALLRGREVTCHGTPFFAGWGLTRDLGNVSARRQRKLSLDELVAGVLLLYPRYLDPVTGLPCPPEVLVGRMVREQMPNRQGWIGPLRRLQGRIVSRFRSRRHQRAQSGGSK